MSIVVVLLFVISIILTRIPLFNYLGYEFSTVIALILPWTSGLLTISALKKAYPRNARIDLRKFFDTYNQAFYRSIFLLLVPFVIISLNAFFVKNCSYGEGMLFFLLIPFVTAIYCWALAGFCLAATRIPYLTYIALNLGVLFYPLYLGWSTPQISSYNFIYGYFPGFSYDEVIEINSTLLLFRAVTLVVSILLVLLTSFIIRRKESPYSAHVGNVFQPAWNTLAIALCVVTVFLSWWYRVPLGFETTTQLIQQTLSSEYETENFHIHYTPGSFSPQEIKWVGAEHEFRLQQVERALRQPYPRIIDSYIYPDDDTKRKFIGTGTTNIAKPWRAEIHLNKDAWESTLRHELVHVVAGQFGMPIIKANYNIGLVEGLAVAVDNDYGNRTLHEYAAAIRKFGILDNPGKLISANGFMTQASTLSYVLMGSFCKYLLDRYGTLRFKRIYGGESPAFVYGQPYEALVNEWQKYLDRVDVPESWRTHMEYYFKRPSIFAIECARTVAKLNQRGWRALDQNDPATANEQFSLSLQKSWNSEAFGGLVRTAYREEKYDTLITLMENNKQDSTFSMNLMLFYGDALWYRDDLRSAQRRFFEIALLDLSDSFDEVVALRLAALKDETLMLPMSEYFTSHTADSISERLLTHLEERSKNPILPYLKAKIYMQRDEYQKAIDTLRSISVAMPYPILDERKDWLLAECYYRLLRFQQSSASAWVSLNFIDTKSHRDAVDDWLARCDWFEANAAKFGLFTDSLQRK
jgi:tetratricopeptide (TPR) repeat protein